VWYVPLFGAVLDRPSLTHFYRPGLPGGLVPLLTPGTRWRGDRLFARAVERYREGQLAAAFVQLGRAAHLLTDMACPVHAQRTVHMISDSFEWYVEGNARALEILPVPAVATRRRASELVEDLAGQTQRFPADTTNSPWGRLLWEGGTRRNAPVPLLGGHDHQRVGRPAVEGGHAPKDPCPDVERSGVSADPAGGRLRGSAAAAFPPACGGGRGQPRGCPGACGCGG